MDVTSEIWLLPGQKWVFQPQPTQLRSSYSPLLLSTSSDGEVATDATKKPNTLQSQPEEGRSQKHSPLSKLILLPPDNMPDFSIRETGLSQIISPMGIWPVWLVFLILAGEGGIDLLTSWRWPSLIFFHHFQMHWWVETTCVFCIMYRVNSFIWMPTF